MVIKIDLSHAIAQNTCEPTSVAVGIHVKVTDHNDELVTS